MGSSQIKPDQYPLMKLKYLYDVNFDFLLEALKKSLIIDSTFNLVWQYLLIGFTVEFP